MSSALIEHFRHMALYNKLANKRLYSACWQLPQDEYRKPRPAFFGSIHATLNHILVGDRIWLGRFENRDSSQLALDTVLYEHFDKLVEARKVEDERIERFAESLNAERLSQDLEYLNSAGEAYCDPLAVLVAHLFNHQTHHRGQVHDMLCQTSVAPPSLDMHRVLNP